MGYGGTSNSRSWGCFSLVHGGDVVSGRWGNLILDIVFFSAFRSRGNSNSRHGTNVVFRSQVNGCGENKTFESLVNGCSGSLHFRGQINMRVAMNLGLNIFWAGSAQTPCFIPLHLEKNILIRTML